MIDLNKENLCAKAHMGAIQYQKTEDDRELNARKYIKDKAQELFEQEFPKVVAEIERRASKGFIVSFYPILYWSEYKTLWKNVEFTQNGELWLDGNYKFEEFNLRTLYEHPKLNPFKSRSGFHDRKMRFADHDEKHEVMVRLAFRHVARELLKRRLNVAYTEYNVVEKIGFKSICGRQLPFLRISLK